MSDHIKSHYTEFCDEFFFTMCMTSPDSYQYATLVKDLKDSLRMAQRVLGNFYFQLNSTYKIHNKI